MNRKKRKQLEADDQSELTPNGAGNHVSLSAPWGRRQLQHVMGIEDPEAVENFVKERTRVHELFIREQEKTKRLSLFLSSVLVLSAGLIVLFAPQGRETLSYWIGAAILIMAAGAAGYKRIWGKTRHFTFGADQDHD